MAIIGKNHSLAFFANNAIIANNDQSDFGGYEVYFRGVRSICFWKNIH